MTYADNHKTKTFTTLKYKAPNLLDMLAYKRPQKSKYQGKFCRRFLEPVFGKPDLHGNYYMIIGDRPRVAFMSHHDTVHTNDGRQVVVIDGDFVKAPSNSNCLGADCTTGVYIMLRMIEAKVPGVYVVHAAEEIGCLGSAALVKDFPSWMSHVDFAISFDRMGYDSIITHQTSMRTCSDEFAQSLADILDLGFKADDTGVYTDSNEYTDFISECTNISVGYFNQHSKNEKQDLVFLEVLIQQLCDADWSKLVAKRVAGTQEYVSYARKGRSMKHNDYYKSYERRPISSVDYYNDPWSQDYGRVESDEGIDIDNLVKVIKRYPQEVAQLLESFGYSPDGLLDDCINISHKSEHYYGH